MDKEKILGYLKKNGKTAISKLSKELNIHYYRLQLVLSELKKEKKINQTQEGAYVYIEIEQKIQRGFGVK